MESESQRDETPEEIAAKLISLMQKQGLTPPVIALLGQWQDARQQQADAASTALERQTDLVAMAFALALIYLRGGQKPSASEAWHEATILVDQKRGRGEEGEAAEACEKKMRQEVEAILGPDCWRETPSYQDEEMPSDGSSPTSEVKKWL